MLWTGAYMYMRHFLDKQLRDYKWAMWRQAGCDWLNFSWLEGAQIISNCNDPDNPAHRTNIEWLTPSPRPRVNEDKRPAIWRRLGKWILAGARAFTWMSDSPQVIDPRLEVYPVFLEQAWIKAMERGSTSAIDERVYKTGALLAFLVGAFWIIHVFTRIEPLR